MTMRKPLNCALATAIAAGSLAVGGTALAQQQQSQQQSQLQGLYSVDELMGAEVYSNQGNSNSIGEVEDVLLDESMKLHSLAIDTGNLLDMGENQYIIEQGNFTVETRNGENRENVEYRVMVDMTEEEITQQPEYNNDWWTETKQTTRQAWENTKETANSAWKSTKSATSDALNSAGNAVEEAGNETQQAADNATENSGNSN